jgi:hypothetical protein
VAAAEVPDPNHLDTLATAQAADGRYADAITTTEQALALARARAEAALIAELGARLILYRSGRPYRTPSD